MIRHEISDWLYDKCKEIWNPENNMGKVIDGELISIIANSHLGSDNPIGQLQQLCLENFSRIEMLDYHMGNMTSSQSAIKWANIHATSKTKAINYYLDGLILCEDNVDSLIENIKNCKTILDANGRDEIKLVYIKNSYEYWDCLSDDELYQI